MITRRELFRALDRRTISDWVVLEREQEVGSFDDAHGLERRESATRFTVVIHHDEPRGRGSARLEIGATEARADELVDQALALATAAIGPVWRSIPPAAPAKVAVLDPKLATADLVAAARGVVAQSRVPAGVTARSRVRVMRERVAVEAHSGFHAEWAASHVRAETLVIAHDRSLELGRESRRLADLKLADAIAHAVGDLARLATAGPPAGGQCDLVIGPDALLHDGQLGMWTIFATQADAVVESQGLSRYRIGSPIVPGANELDEPIRIVSDGALDFATRSAPVGDDGDAIRKFPLIERGVCVGLGLSAREAAFRRLDPNGGVRNLVIDRGTFSDLDPARRTVELRRLRSIAMDPYTGESSLEVGLAVDHLGPKHLAFTGGTIRLDLVSALVTAWRSGNGITRGPYSGPASVLIRDVELVA